MVLVREQLRRLVWVQARKSPAEAGEGKKLGPLSCHETRQLDEITGPFYRSPLPDLWQSQGVFGRKETPFPIPRLRACLVGWV